MTRPLLAALAAALLAAADEMPLPARLDAIAAASRIVGAAAAVVADGRVQAVWTWGAADRRLGRAVDAGTVFRFGSISKHLTGLLAARLAAAGRLDLQAPVAALLPDVRIDNPWAERHPLLLIHLLEHTGGLPGSDLAEYARDAADLDPADYARGRAWRLRWPPGRFYSYANAGHTLAAAAMQRALGRGFDALLRDEVLLPAGMAGTGLRSGPDPAASASYRDDGAPAGWWALPMRPSGAAAGTIGDLAALVRLHATGLGADGTPFLAPERLEELFVGRTAADVRAGFATGSYGLGGFGFLAADRIWHGHWGKIDGFLAAFGVLPGSGSGFALVVNTADGRGRWRLMDALARHAAGGRSPPPPLPPPAGIDLRPYAGWYQCATHEMEQRDWIWRLLGTVRIDADGDRLRVRPVANPWRGGHELVAIDAVRFREPGHWLPRDAFVAVEGSRWYIGDQRAAFRPISAATAWAWIVLAWAALGACVLLPVGAGLALAGRWRGRAGAAIAALAAGAGLCLLAMVGAYAAWGVFDAGAGARLLGAPTWASLGILLLSLAAPLCLLAACRLLLRRWRGLGWWRHAWAVAIAVLGAAMAALAVRGWIPLVTWA